MSTATVPSFGEYLDTLGRLSSHVDPIPSTPAGVPQLVGKRIRTFRWDGAGKCLSGRREACYYTPAA